MSSGASAQSAEAPEHVCFKAVFVWDARTDWFVVVFWVDRHRTQPKKNKNYTLFDTQYICIYWKYRFA